VPPIFKQDDSQLVAEHLPLLFDLDTAIQRLTVDRPDPWSS
jgi:PKHD-type hydroxylase C-terminal domain